MTAVKSKSLRTLFDIEKPTLNKGWTTVFLLTLSNISADTCNRDALRDRRSCPQFEKFEKILAITNFT